MPVSDQPIDQLFDDYKSPKIYQVSKIPSNSSPKCLLSVRLRPRKSSTSVIPNMLWRAKIAGTLETVKVVNLSAVSTVALRLPPRGQHWQFRATADRKDE